MHEYIVVRDYDQPNIYIHPLKASLSYHQFFKDKDTMEYGGNIVTDAYMAMEYFSNNWYYLGSQVLGKDKLLKWALENDLSAIGLNDDGEPEWSAWRPGMSSYPIQFTPPTPSPAFFEPIKRGNLLFCFDFQSITEN